MKFKLTLILLSSIFILTGCNPDGDSNSAKREGQLKYNTINGIECVYQLTGGGTPGGVTCNWEKYNAK